MQDLKTEINDVILTSRQVRELLFRNGEIQEHTLDDIKVCQQVIAANKNIVSACIVQMTYDKTYNPKLKKPRKAKKTDEQ